MKMLRITKLLRFRQQYVRDNELVQHVIATLSRTCSVCQKEHFHVGSKYENKRKNNTIKSARYEYNRQLKALKKEHETEERTRNYTTPTVIEMSLQDNAEIGKVDDGASAIFNSNDSLSKTEFMQRLSEIHWDMKALAKKKRKENFEMDDNESNDEKNVSDDDKENLVKIFSEEIFLDKKHLKETKVKVHIKSTVDPDLPITDIPCNGCGAKLHCQDTAIAGFIPSDKFKSMSMKELTSANCQRCSMIRNHNVFLNVEMPEDEFPKLFSRIQKDQNCLVLLLVDLLDLENSVPQELINWVGRNQQFFILGNKVDLIPNDGPGYLDRVKSALLKVCEPLNVTGSNIRHVALVSGRTGYGVERLITKLVSDWERRGDVFLIGNANSGKSTFFNTLLRSDYCKTSVQDTIKRATISDWPGTTMSLLKFPIVNMAPWKLARRVQRFKNELQSVQAELALRHSRAKTGDYKSATLWGFVGRTDFRDPDKVEKQEEAKDVIEGFDLPTFEYAGKERIDAKYGKIHIMPEKKAVNFDPNKYLKAKWFYDTPGIESKQQILSYLNQEELSLVLARQVIIPRVFLLHPLRTLFISGLSRIDYTWGLKPMYITVYTASGIPVCDCDTDEAEEYYNKHVGTKKLGVPLGDQQHLEKIPSLVEKNFTIKPHNWWEASTDIQLSSLGWFSIMYGAPDDAEIKVYTPGGYGIQWRQPSIHPNVNNFRRKKIKNSVAFHTTKPKL